MNGSFKIALTKFKRELMAILIEKGSQFVQTDIIPLVRKSWNASFAKKEKAKSANAKRGWNPLNYILLDHPNLKDDQVSRASDPTVTSTDNDTQYEASTATINIEGKKN
jgi:hypothetical protein